MYVLLTGATGAVGSHLVSAPSSAGTAPACWSATGVVVSGQPTRPPPRAGSRGRGVGPTGLLAGRRLRVPPRHAEVRRRAVAARPPAEGVEQADERDRTNRQPDLLPDLAGAGRPGALARPARRAAPTRPRVAGGRAGGGRPRRRSTPPRPSPVRAGHSGPYGLLLRRDAQLHARSFPIRFRGESPDTDQRGDITE